MHRFYHHQPDLNTANPAVRDAIHKVIGFWLELGLSGFRVDAVPFLIEQEGIASPATGDPHDYLRDLRAFMTRRRGDAVLLAEANEPADKLALFFGDEHGDQMHVLFSFIGNQAMYPRPWRRAPDGQGTSLAARSAAGRTVGFVRAES